MSTSEHEAPGAREASDGDSGRSSNASKGEVASKARTEWKVAVLGGIIALLGALIGGSMALVGTVIQANAAEQQATQEFLRNQRQVAYSRVLSDIQVLSRLQHEWADGLFVAAIDGVTAAPSELLDSKAMHDSLHTLESSISNMQIVGSEESSTEAWDAFSRLSQRQYDIDTIILRLERGEGPSTFKDEVASPRMTNFDTSLLLDTIRKDLVVQE